MKTRIIITEKQYKEIFLTEKYGNIINEQLINNFGDDFVKFLKGTLKDAEVTTYNRVTNKREGLYDLLNINSDDLILLDDIFGNIDNYTSLINKIKNKSVYSVNDLERLYGIKNFKNIIFSTLKNDEEVVKLFKLRKTLNSKFGPNYPDRIKVDNIINRYFPSKIKDDLTKQVESIPKSEIKGSVGDDLKNLVNKDFDDITSIDLVNILTKADSLDDLGEWITKNSNLVDQTFNNLPVNIWDASDLKSWVTIFKDIKKHLPKIKKNAEELENYLFINNIKVDDFLATIKRISPGRYKKLFMYVLKRWPGASNSVIFYLIYIGLPILIGGYTTFQFLKKIYNLTKTDPKEENDANIKSKFLTWFKENSPESSKLYSENPEGFTITIDGNNVSFFDKGGVLGDKLGGKVYEYTYNETDGTFKYINDDETSPTGTFENSLEGFKKWIIAPESEGGFGQSLQSNDIPSGVKDNFTIKYSDGDITDFKFENGTFK